MLVNLVLRTVETLIRLLRLVIPPGKPRNRHQTQNICILDAAGSVEYSVFTEEEPRKPEMCSNYSGHFQQKITWLKNSSLHKDRSLTLPDVSMALGVLN